MPPYVDPQPYPSPAQMASLGGSLLIPAVVVLAIIGVLIAQARRGELSRRRAALGVLLIGATLLAGYYALGFTFLDISRSMLGPGH